MNCPFCDHPRSHRHGKTSQGSQRDRCPRCQPTFTATFDPVYYRRQVTSEQARTLLQAHSEGSKSAGGESYQWLGFWHRRERLRASRSKGQLAHHQAVQAVETEATGVDACWSLVKKAKAVSTGRNRSWRRLDGVEFGATEWVHFSGACRYSPLMPC